MVCRKSMMSAIFLGFLAQHCGPVADSQPSGDSLKPLQLSLGTYNVENFWDDNDTNTKVPYDDYAPSTSNWSKDKMYLVKAKHTAEAIRLAGSPDVLALQEIESGENTSRSLDILKSELAAQGYHHFALGQQAQDNPTAVTTAVISKHPIVANETLDFPGDDSARDPQVVTVEIAGQKVRIYNNHWKSKRGKPSAETEPARIEIAELIQKDIANKRKAEPSLDILVLGDLNSQYNETQLEKVKKTGIVDVLKATGDLRMLFQICDRLYNLWFELPVEKRGSYSHGQNLNTLDHILVNDSLLDQKGLQLVPKSFRVIGGDPQSPAGRKLLNADGSPLRWQVFKTSKTSPSVHVGVGYSDHLPLVADFVLHPKGGSSQKISVDSPSTTEFGPAVQRKLSSPVCSEAEATLTLGKDDPTLPENFGKCIEFSGEELTLTKLGQHSVGVELDGKKTAITMNYAHGSNMNFLRNTLQRADGKTLKKLHGRIGYDFGLTAIFLDKPTDIVFE